MNRPGGEGSSGNSDYRPWQVRIFASTWLAYAGYYFCRMAFYVVKNRMGDDLGFSTVDLAHLGTAYLFGYTVGQFSSAYFGRRLGPKLLLLVGTAISITCNMTFGASNGFWTILLFMSLNGLAQGTGWPGCIGSLAFWFKRRQRGSILGVWSTCYQLGPVMASSFAAMILGIAGWRWSFFGASLVLLGVWFIVLLLHPNRPEDVGLEPIQDEYEDATTTGSEEEEGKGLGWTRDVVITIIIMGAIYFCIKFLRYTLFSWTPLFLSRNFGLAGDQAGYLSTVFQACGFGGVIFAGFASDKIFKGKRSFISFAMIAMMMLSFLLMVVLGRANLLYFAISIGLVGFMLYGPDSLLSGVGAIDVGSKRGALVAAGIINGMGSTGSIFQEELVGLMYDRYNQELLPILILLFTMAAIATLLTLLLWINARRGRSNL